MVCKHLLYEDTCVTVEFEVVADKVFLHCDVHRWSAGSHRHLLNVLSEIKTELVDWGHQELYCAAHLHNKKLIRFASMLGFEPTDQMTDDNRIVLKLGAWDG